LLLLHDVLGVAASQGQAGSIIEIGAAGTGAGR
jgi:hypothetical protein